MAEKTLYTSDEVQNILKKAIEATAKGLFEFINNESVVFDKLNKIEIPGVSLEIKYSSQTKISHYISQELSKVGIKYIFNK